MELSEMQQNIIELQNPSTTLIITQPSDNFAIFLGTGKDKINTHIDLIHNKPNLQSLTLIKAVLFDESELNITGNIIINTGAKYTDAYLKISVLMLSKKARANVVPALEIMENDVKGGHGATVGQVDEDELFYLMSKGLNRVTATRVLVEGFLRDVTDRITDQKVLKSINAEIEEKLSKLEDEQ